MKSKSLYATLSGPTLSFSLVAFSLLILSIFGKSYAPLVPMFKQMQLFAGPNFGFYAGIIGFVLLVLSVGFSFIDQKMLQQKMEAKTESGKWVLTLSAIYVELSKVLEADDVQSFYRIDMTRAWYMPFTHIFTGLVLKKSWGIFDRNSALQTLHTLLLKANDDREKPYVAWDAVRFSHVARLACICGYLTPEETWEELKKIGSPVQKKFSSWKELNENFLKGRKLWNGGANDMDQLKASYNQLAAHAKSPWQTVGWGMRLEN